MILIYAGSREILAKKFSSVNQISQLQRKEKTKQNSRTGKRKSEETCKKENSADKHTLPSLNQFSFHLFSDLLD